MRVTFLGTGTSRGVPVIGCDCRICTSSDPRNKRCRSSVLIEGEVTVVIDTSVDFRQQMLRCGTRKLDAVVFTHPHMDHILGLDDVYPFNLWAKKSIPAYASQDTLEEIRMTFRHLFKEKRYPGIPEIELVPIEGNFQIGDLVFEPIEVMHGRLPVLGFRIGKFAYVTDVSHIPDKAARQLSGVEYLVLDGLRYKSHPTHFSIPEAVEAAAQLNAKQTFLIHMSHEVDHEEGNAMLPESVRLSYDGQVLEVE